MNSIFVHIHILRNLYMASGLIQSGQFIIRTGESGSFNVLMQISSQDARYGKGW